MAQLIGQGFDLIGARPGQNGQQEFYNTQSGLGFENPNVLSQFVNTQYGQQTNPNDVFNTLAQGYSPRDAALNQIKTDLNSFQNDTFSQAQSPAKRAASSLTDQIGSEQGNYDTYFKEYNDLKTKLQAIQAPNYQQSYNDLRQSSGIGQVENDFANNQKSIRELPYVNRQNFGNGGVATEGQLQADTAQKGIPLEIQQGNLLDRMKLAQAFIDNSLKFKELDSNAARQSLSDALDLSLQTIDLSRTHLNDLLQQQAVQKAQEEKAQNFAYENRIGKPFYEIGGTVYRTSDGRPATSPQDYIQMGGTGDFRDVQKVDVSQTFENQLSLAQLDLQKQQLEYQQGATKYQLGTDAWGNPIVFNPRTGTYTGGDSTGGGSEPYYGLAPKVYDKAAAIVNQFDGEAIAKKYNTVADGNNYAQSIDPNTKNPADNQAMISAFAKALDPESVVREGEYATVQKYAQSWLESFGFNAMRVVNNQEFLTPDAIKNMQKVIQDKYNSTNAQYQNLYSEYARRVDAATGVQGKGNEMLTDYSKAYKAQSDPILNNLWGDGFTTSSPLDLNKAKASGGLTFSSVGNTSASFKSFSDYAKVIGNGKIVSGSSAHKGGEIDIDGKIGDPVYAFAGGKVIQVVDQGSKDYGKKIVVQDAQGNQYIYGHLNGFNVKVGQTISAGFPIGAMGNTGNVVASKGGDGSHLHIEKRDGKGRVIALNTLTRLA